MSIRKIRQYQQECVASCDALPAGGRGQVILPTGSGKTIIGEEVIKNTARRGDTTVSTVFVPRLLLGKQWIHRSATSLIKQSGLPFAFVNINSGGLSNSVKKMIEQAQFKITGPGVPAIKTTTSPEELSKEVKSLKKKGFHVIALSTYHSSGVLKESGVRSDLALYDECQFLVSASSEETTFTDSLDINADRRIFMTATPSYTDSADGRGMHNVSKFGNVLFQRSPKHIIEAGAIVGPKIHLIGSEGIIESRDYNSRADMIVQAWQRHKEQVKKNSIDPDQIGGKLLVVCDGQMTLEGIMSCRRFREIREERPDLKFYALSSDYGIYIDGDYRQKVNNSDKERLLEALYSLATNDDAIILHHDMIAEGLDVPGITGVIPLRNCRRSKFLQNLGRSARLHPEDARRIFETGELEPCDYANYIKPNCYVILPYLIENRDDFLVRNGTIIDELRSEYGFDPSENIICDFLNPAQQGPVFPEDLIEREIRGTTDSLRAYYHKIENEAVEVEEFIAASKVRRFTKEQLKQFITAMARNQ